MTHVYYDKDADLKHLKNKKIGIVGYGIQGRAHALNLRDSGVHVLVGNRQDAYKQQVIRDGFLVHPIKEVVKESDIILFLIPDEAQKEVYEKFISPYLRVNSMLVFAHGYALRYKTIRFPSDIDIGMLAPRMPGGPIRESFLQNSGIPAFIDIVQDKTGVGLKKLLAIAKGMGFTRAGVLKVDYHVEAELDLFVEQYLIPNFLKTIHLSFDYLVRKMGYPPIPTLLELYASGELAEVLKLAAHIGIGKTFQQNASPTCQFGIASNFHHALEIEPIQQIKKVVHEIKKGKFKRALEKEASLNYPSVKELWATMNSKMVLDTHRKIDQLFKSRSIER